MYYIYIIRCTDGSLYTGITDNVARRFVRHKKRKGGHYTASHAVLRVLHTEACGTKSAALKREAQIKSWRRKKKLELIKKSGP